MDREFIAKHWYADVYEQFENQTDDVEFFIKIIRELTGGKPQRILEAACGGGRISVPLALEGHSVTGFDANEHMLLRCYSRARGMQNFSCRKADAVCSDWGEGFDIVVLAGNVLINIETETDYKSAQRIFINKTAGALRRGGHLLMDYDQHSDASALKVFNGTGERVYFEGTDDMGTRGRTVSLGGAYDPITRVCTGIGHWELTANNGEKFIYAEKPRCKHIPSWPQVTGWLSEAGLAVEKTYKNRANEPVGDNESDYIKATVWARKD